MTMILRAMTHALLWGDGGATKDDAQQRELSFC